METISARELERYAREGRTLIIDLRSRVEFMRGHVPGAINVPRGQFRDELRARGQEPVVLYCGRGAFSMTVARELEKRGYRTKSVVGGFRAYRGKMISHND